MSHVLRFLAFSAGLAIVFIHIPQYRCSIGSNEENSELLSNMKRCSNECSVKFVWQVNNGPYLSIDSILCGGSCKYLFIYFFIFLNGKMNLRYQLHFERFVHLTEGRVSDRAAYCYQIHRLAMLHTIISPFRVDSWLCLNDCWGDVGWWFWKMYCTFPVCAR